VKKSAKNCPNVAHNGALLNKNFYPKTLLVKLWEFKVKKLPKFRAYLGEFWAISLKKLRPNFSQSGHTDCCQEKLNYLFKVAANLSEF
jgi:hypothetical protein